VRAWLLGAAALLVVVGVAVLLLARDDSGPAQPTGRVGRAVTAAGPAVPPFRGMTATRVRVGARTLRVVVADDLRERTQGLRRRSTIGRYDGMLFVFDAPTEAGFTMSTVPVPLDIGFYDARGRAVERFQMQPCAHAEASCPVYRAAGPFSYALETLAGELPRGALAAP
jgi:uncharacterized membrane protein (UPF0127 family)